jgi:hypothetical protein
LVFGCCSGRRKGRERDTSGRLRRRRHGSENTGMLKSTETDSRRSKRRCKASRLHSGDDQNRTIVRPVLQRIVNLLCVPHIITSQTKKCLTACMRSYGNIVNTLRGLKAKVILWANSVWGAKENRAFGRTDRNAPSDWPFSVIDVIYCPVNRPCKPLP